MDEIKNSTTKSALDFGNSISIFMPPNIPFMDSFEKLLFPDWYP